ncbi:MAG TPA: flagellar hook-associated protein FlgL [Terracidiphilus sp.]|nr:flagellar hook-associated protein FlgL [Terracidiphilus sp.]
MNPNIFPDIESALNQSQAVLNNALEVVATGKSVNLPSDNPTASAALVQNQIETANVDQYTQNVSGASSQVQTASSVLSNVVSLLNKAISDGTQGANGTTSSADLQSLAADVQNVLSSVVSLANTSYEGSYLFGGTATNNAPFTANGGSPTGYQYNGNTDQNSVAIGDNQTIQVNLPGSQIFTNASANVLGSLSQLVTALQGGTSAQIATAVSSVTGALDYVSQQQEFYGNADAQLSSQTTFLQQETVSLTSQQTTLSGVNLAQAATNLSQAETDNSAALAAAAKVMPQTLLNYLTTPS